MAQLCLNNQRQMCGTKALQWIVRNESLERLDLRSHAFFRYAVGIEMSWVERQQIVAPFGLQVGDGRPHPLERLDDLAAMLDRVTCCLPLVPIPDAQKPGRGKQRQKRRDPQDHGTNKPARG